MDSGCFFYAVFSYRFSKLILLTRTALINAVRSSAVLFALLNVPSFSVHFSENAKVQVTSALAQTPSCLSPTTASRPAWECYDLATTLAPGAKVTLQHTSGETHYSTVFALDTGNFVRFTPSQRGLWSSDDGHNLLINQDRQHYAKGFVVNLAGRWGRSATGEVFVPQFVMHDDGDPFDAKDELLKGHGFTGLHITNLREFARNPEYFEEIVLSTYRLGGATHFWIWADAERNQIPDDYPITNQDAATVDELYQLIAARLGPIPGWTVGFGFDLFEWLTEEHINEYRNAMSQYSSYKHLLGARGFKNRYRRVTENTDYASWEWHRPDLDDYVDHVTEAAGEPAFSEDRFRIRDNPSTVSKDYDEQRTVVGLWDSLFAGGVANIWGKALPDGTFSDVYLSQEQILRYRTIVDKMYTPETASWPTSDEQVDCLLNPSSFLCRFSNTDSIALDELPALFGDIPIELIDIHSNLSFCDTEHPATLNLPATSDWVLLADPNSSCRFSVTVPLYPVYAMLAATVLFAAIYRMRR